MKKICIKIKNKKVYSKTIEKETFLIVQLRGPIQKVFFFY